MNYVQPIRDREKINNMKRVLRERGERDYILFLLGINTGMRISDMLKLKVGDVVSKEHIVLRETKTKKHNRFYIPPSIRKELDTYAVTLDYDDFLFKSRVGYNRPITRQQAFNVLKAASRRVGIAEVGTHTMRKTFGYHFYTRTKDVVLLMQIFNHADPSITLRYIGISEQNKESALKGFSL